MISDLQSYTEAIKVTIPNLIKLLTISVIAFIVVPRYIFPQKGIKTQFDKIVYNIIYMLSAIVTIIPFLEILHIFSMITLILSFFLLKALLLYIFEKKNLFELIRKSYPPLFIKVLNKLDAFTHKIINGNFEEYKRLISYKFITNIDFLRNIVILLFLIYAIFDINFINLSSLNNKTSDVSQFIEWVANLKKNILYADHKTGGADFYGLATFVFFLQTITNIDSVLLFSLYPTLIFLFHLLGIFYVLYKITGSKNSGFFGILIYVLYCLSPLGEYVTGRVFSTSNPPIINLFGLKIYFSLMESIKFKNLDVISYAPFIRLNSGLAYEISAGFFLLNLYFLTMSLWKKENIYVILYGLTLYLVFVFHGGGAFLLVVSSILIFLNAIIFAEINFEIIRKGVIGIFLPAIFGNLWILSWLKYGIPQDFGNAAPILDKIFKTENSKKVIVKEGKEVVDMVVFYREQLIIILLMLVIYPLSIIFFRKRRFLVSSMSLAIIGVIFIYLEENLGFPRLVSQLRCADYLFLVTALSGGIYFGIIENLMKRVLRKWTEYVLMMVLIIFAISTILIVPSYNDTEKFFKFTNSVQYNAIALALYKIKKSREPYTYTIVGFVQSYSKVMDKGYHINVSEFLQKYNPYDPELKIDSKYIYIILETIPIKYEGTGEWYYRWRKDLELALASWIDIYSRYHNNIKVYMNRDYVTIYEIDNRKYYRSLLKKRLKERRGFLPK